MHKKLRTVAAALASTLAALAMFMGSAAADVTVAISPSLLEFAVDQGASFAQTITVSNEGSDPAAISVQVSPYGQTPEHLSATDWFLASPDKFELEPGTTKDVNVYIQVPDEVEPGGRYATVFFRTSALSAGNKLSRFVGGTGVGAQIGSVFLLTVRGPDLKLEGELTKVVPMVVGPSRIGSRIEITNTGNVHLVPSGEVELKDAEGNVVGRFALPETTALLPGETKSFDLSGAEELPDGDYQASASIEYGWNEDQISAAEVDPKEWAQIGADKQITFNSVPKLRVVEVSMHDSDESGAEVELAVENYGDVEVSPAGFIDVLNKAGERLSLLNIKSTNWAVEPHSTSHRTYSNNGPIPKGEYTLAAEFSYHGEETAAQTFTAVIEEEILPPLAPEAPAARQAQYAPKTPGWMWPAMAAAGMAVFAALGASAWTLRRNRARLAAGDGAMATQQLPIYARELQELYRQTRGQTPKAEDLPGCATDHPMPDHGS